MNDLGVSPFQETSIDISMAFTNYGQNQLLMLNSYGNYGNYGFSEIWPTIVHQSFCGVDWPSSSMVS